MCQYRSKHYDMYDRGFFLHISLIKVKISISLGFFLHNHFRRSTASGLEIACDLPSPFSDVETHLLGCFFAYLFCYAVAKYFTTL